MIQLSAIITWIITMSELPDTSLKNVIINYQLNNPDLPPDQLVCSLMAALLDHYPIWPYSSVGGEVPQLYCLKTYFGKYIRKLRKQKLLTVHSIMRVPQYLHPENITIMGNVPVEYQKLCTVWWTKEPIRKNDREILNQGISLLKGAKYDIIPVVDDTSHPLYERIKRYRNIYNKLSADKQLEENERATFKETSQRRRYVRSRKNDLEGGGSNGQPASKKITILEKIRRARAKSSKKEV